jgi:hypothetical protein
MNTCKSLSKQKTLSIFKINTYKKPRGEGVLWLTKYPMRIFVLRSIATIGNSDLLGIGDSDPVGEDLNSLPHTAGSSRAMPGRDCRLSTVV